MYMYSLQFPHSIDVGMIMTRLKLNLISTLVFPLTEKKKKKNPGQMDRLPKIISRLTSRLQAIPSSTFQSLA